MGRNCLLGHRKKIAKFLMRTFTCRSTFLYGLNLSSTNGPDQLKYSPIDRTSAEDHTRHTEQNPQNYLMDFELIIRMRKEIRNFSCWSFRNIPLSLSPGSAKFCIVKTD
jgi:hypothetical protein